MNAPVEGYVLHTYGPARYLRHAVASVATLRRYDATRPVALFCPRAHQEVLEHQGLTELFQHVAPLPPAHQSIVGFKHHLPQFAPFDRSLFVDADMIWCRNPDPLWTRLSTFAFTATGLPKADFFFGGPKGAGVLLDILLNRRGRTLRRFGLTYLPRVQAGMIYLQDRQVGEEVCRHARRFLDERTDTHFRSRLDEGRSEETCEWSLAMAMSRLELPIFPWLQGHESPQLDYIDSLTTHDADFYNVTCQYHTTGFVYGLRGLAQRGLREALIRGATRLPGCGDFLEVTPFVVHFGWLHQKEPFYTFANRVWQQLEEEGPERVVPRAPQPSPAASSR